MTEHAAVHNSRYKDTVFKSRLEARYAAFFDLAGWAWEYEPLVLNGWTPNFRVTFPCGHSECNATHILLVEVQPYFNISDFEGHPGNKYHWGWDYDKNVALPFDASACFGISPEVSSFMMTHGAGGGEDRITDWVHNWEALWETADSQVENKPRNFAAEAAKDLMYRKKEWRHLSSKVTRQIDEYLNILRNAVHFSVPLGFGSCENDFDDAVNNIIEWDTDVKVFRLPYKRITLSVTYVDKDGQKEDVLLICEERPAGSFTAFKNAVLGEPGEIFSPSGDHAIVMYPVARDPDAKITNDRIFDDSMFVIACDFEWWFDACPRVLVAALPSAGFEGITVGADHKKNADAVCLMHAETLLRFLYSLATTHTEEVIQQASPKNNRRILDGKLPIWEVKTLVLKTPVTRTVSEYQGGTHASPRQHIRRGHYRHYKSGKIAWVRDCIVGSLEKGFVHKDYRVEPAAA